MQVRGLRIHLQRGRDRYLEPLAQPDFPEQRLDSARRAPPPHFEIQDQGEHPIADLHRCSLCGDVARPVPAALEVLCQIELGRGDCYLPGEALGEGVVQDSILHAEFVD